ncbi:hypothetical protein CDD82_6823 [Ophiocordyceps australis]|uniref:RFTS domain-containing protein n=1 Tax=Ophiocordyceps australis TaxID=1399860 RepID=A0A2C5YTV4_9HYPO|nr:hypothetical protein CDD82_6823 [Ophiocordyceps australis]
MAGRKRRASTSSVESIDNSHIHWRQEASVVRTVAREVPSDEWPTFELRDATVLNKDGQTIENALHVGYRGPYIIRGYLIIDDAPQKAHLITKVRSSTPLEIRECKAFSIGQQDNGSPVIWVSGRGGWYEINPSPTYRPVYRKICEATTFYYDLVDIYNSRPLSKKPKKDLKESVLSKELSTVFHQYAARVGDGVTLPEVYDRCSEHAGFFISQFDQQDRLVDWESTGFHQWLTTKHKDLADLMKTPLKLSAPPSIASLSPKPRREFSAAASKSASVERCQTPVAASRRRLRGSSSLLARTASPVTVHEASKPPIQREARHSPANSLSQEARHTTPKSVSQESRKPGRPRLRESMLPPKPLAPESPQTKPVQETTQVVDAAQDGSPLDSVVAALASMHDAMVSSKKGLSTNGVVSKLYYDYSFPNYRDGTPACYKVPVVEVLHYNAASLLRALDKTKYQHHEIWSFLQELTTREFNPVAYKMAEFPVRLVKRKRINRGSKKDLVPAAQAEADVSESSPMPRGKSVKRPGRKPAKSSLRPASATKKRPRSEYESEGEGEAAAIDESHFFEDAVPEAAQYAVDADSSPTRPPVDAPAEVPEEEAVRLVIRAEKLPSPTPKGPDGAWACDQDGCDYVVRGADETDIHAQIQAHFGDHEQQLERLSLAMTESRGHMPIKYAYFPPFLICVCLDSPSRAPSRAPSPLPAPSPSPLPEQQPAPDLSGSAQRSFRALVRSFYRRPQPVSDRIHSLTLPQPLARQDQAHRRESPASPRLAAQWRRPSPEDKEEADSVTLAADSD